MDAGNGFVSPVVTPDVLNRFSSPVTVVIKKMMRYGIMNVAGKVKGFVPPPFEVAASAAETNYSAVDALLAFYQISGDSGVLEFQSIVGKLPIDDLRTLEMLLKEPYRMMRMRKNILKMAGKVKGVVFPTPLETATTEAAVTVETNDYNVEDAVRALRRMSGAGDRGVLDFQRIVGELPFNDLKTVEKLLEGPYYMMLGSEMGIDYNPYPYGYPTWRPEVKAAASGGGGDSFVTKLAGQAIGAMLAKVADGAVFGAFEAPAFLEPLEKAAGAVGLMSVIGGMVLQDKKPGLSRAMVKFGSVAIALAIIVPMAGNLENVIMAWICGVLAAAIVALTVTFA